MTETSSQNVQWRTGSAAEKDHRTGFLFASGSGQLLFDGPKLEESDASGEPKTWSGGQSTREAVKGPFAKKFGDHSSNRYILLKKFSGFVVARGETTFSAELFEGGNQYPVMVAEFDLDELSETDRRLAVEGAALVWTIGYYENGPRRRESFVYLRRWPAWNKDEAKKARAAADVLMSDIGWK